MQKIQLHLVLLIFIAIGCGKPSYTHRNPYLVNNNHIDIAFESPNGAPLLFRGTEIAVIGETAPSFRLRPGALSPELWELSWTDDKGDPLPLPRRTARRTLGALSIEDTTLALKQTIAVLPDGSGIAMYLEGRTEGVFGLTLAAGTSDSIIFQSVRERSQGLCAFGGESKRIIVGSKTLGEPKRVSPMDKPPIWQFPVHADKRIQVIIAWGNSSAKVREFAEEHLRESPAKVVRAATVSLGDRLAFQLVTQDDRTNRAFALLGAALAECEPFPNLRYRHRIEDYSQRAAAEWLASRNRPATVFMADPGAITPQQRDDYLRWGSEAFRKAFEYGMAGADTLRLLSWKTLEGIAQFQADYATGDLTTFGDPFILDSLTRLAVAHVRMAGILTLGEDIALARGDHTAQGNFRGSSIRAMRKAETFFGGGYGVSASERLIPSDPLAGVIGSEETAEDDDGEPQWQSPVFEPDTALYLAAGARYGFNWLSGQPTRLWNPRLSVGGFVWQKWVDYTFHSNLKVTDTPDLDSLWTLLLDGPAPGVLTTDPNRDGPPSLDVMAAAFQNLAELYVGIQCNVFRHRVDIEPRLPADWGHTVARVPYERGEIFIEYNFADDYAIVGMDNIPEEIDVFFGFPFADGGFLRTQFKLTPGEHPMRIERRQEADNRYKLDVSEVP